MHGFKYVLTKWLHKIQPDFVLEWGPGESTQTVLEESYANIVSVEHDQKYLDTAKARFHESIEERRLTLVHHPINKSDCQYAQEAFKHGKIDLAFVDGRRRVECVLAAFHNLSVNGVVILHDFSRESYQNMLLPIVDILEVRDNTVVMRPRPSLGLSQARL